MSGIADVQARIQDIVARFEGPPAKTTTDSSDHRLRVRARQGAGADQRERRHRDTGTSATGTLNRAGVDPAKWAQDFLTALGAPVTASNVQAITAWEQAEGTKATVQPARHHAGRIHGRDAVQLGRREELRELRRRHRANVKVITNGLYGNILSALQQGTSAMDVAKAVAASPVGHGHRRRAGPLLPAIARAGVHFVTLRE